MGGGVLTIRESSISGNTGSSVGGLLNRHGAVTLINSTVSGNTGSSVGGVENYEGAVTLINSTVSGNVGAGVMTETNESTICEKGWCCARTAVYSSTISANTGGGILALSRAGCGPSIVVQNSVIANQASGADCDSGSIVSHGHNLDSDGSCNLTDPTDLPGTDPVLGPLQDNGGPTFTHALLPGSPAIGAVPLAECTYDDDGDPWTPEVPLTEDQRGVTRPQGDGCDIGAYEVTACADGLDNDDDGLIDYTEDPGCRDAASVREDPQCQDGFDNEGDGRIDFDGGLSALGYVATDPDPQCFGTPWRNRESVSSSSCGLGAELALLLPLLMMWCSRRRRSR